MIVLRLTMRLDPSIQQTQVDHAIDSLKDHILEHGIREPGLFGRTVFAIDDEEYAETNLARYRKGDVVVMSAIPEDNIPEEIGEVISWQPNMPGYTVCVPPELRHAEDRDGLREVTEDGIFGLAHERSSYA